MMVSKRKKKDIRHLFKYDFYQYHFSRVFTIAEKNLKLQVRFKFKLIYSIVSPFFTIFLSIIIMSRFFEMGTRFGRWDGTNYYIFIFIAYNIELLRKIIEGFPSDFVVEKYWKTFSALMVAPINTLHLLFGIFLSQSIVIAIPFMIFLLLTYLISPISILTLIFVMFIYVLIELIFSGIGLFLGVFAISREGLWHLFTIGINIIFWFSCISYPFEMFPNFVQVIIELNPLYYIFDILRITWLDNNIFLTISNHPFHFIVLILIAIILPITAIFMFKKVYYKFGIVGY